MFSSTATSNLEKKQILYEYHYRNNDSMENFRRGMWNIAYHRPECATGGRDGYLTIQITHSFLTRIMSTFPPSLCLKTPNHISLCQHFNNLSILKLLPSLCRHADQLATRKSLSSSYHLSLPPPPSLTSSCYPPGTFLPNLQATAIVKTEHAQLKWKQCKQQQLPPDKYNSFFHTTLITL